ncbi:uncharacterized protein TrAFT101_008499 [Trichoderma asperellum]|uniref:SnoaL-like domain-containing protein n=1 Tax=Trichoderma asperellum (strain ATCC 204424 / CBS 433.97 / NBRC 101777) TaxID=1042311 RepID=A0A2T3ZC76_TRIA4|nr:hypothetical protein M441DRAFT_57173 [Trichoderma asperellum CBS 433.97]PTB42405.1 hypothetical protein M441DRAFT_57173 [Trichoderma asperellum CBS 433.97]UKZ93588.1 hypothetical protein TrAFT101_008499 [Trichoderma asperellum]
MASFPASYDASSPNEVAPPLPSAPAIAIGPSSVLQPPLSRRGAGPGLIAILPSSSSVAPRPATVQKPLDPEPLQKWAEEGFAVVAITLPANEMEELTGDDATVSDVVNQIREGVEALRAHDKVDTKDRFGLIIYDEVIVPSLLLDAERLQQHGIAGIVTFSESAPDSTAASILPLLSHTSIPPPPPSFEEEDGGKSPEDVKVHSYPGTTPHFVLPSAAAYDNASASMAHTRSLVFLRKHLGGPHFDLEAIWEEHCYWEFVGRSVAKTMATMVAEPYVNHVPTMTGGVGREKLTAFYRDHFIFCNPPDTTLKTVSRTIGPDRIVDEFIFCCTHTTEIPALIPKIAPTNKPLAIPTVGIINIRGDRLYHEHILWDQATVLRQLGILPTHLPYEGVSIKLPVGGAETARLLLDERDGKSNEMIEG